MKISVNKKQKKTLTEAISHWHAAEIIDTATKVQLTESMEIRRFD